MTVIKPFTVTAKGVGRPDYSPEVTPAQAVVGVNQLQWGSWSQLSILSGYYATGTVYTTAAGYRLYVASAVISCEASCIQKMIVQFQASGVITTIGEYPYDLSRELKWESPPFIIPTGGKLIVIVFNYDYATRIFNITFRGILEKTT